MVPVDPVSSNDDDAAPCMLRERDARHSIRNQASEPLTMARGAGKAR